MNGLEILQKKAEKAAELIKNHNFARVISHYDADGITSAGILGNALLRNDIQFHITIVSKLDREFIKGLNEEELLIFCDMGSAQLDIIKEHLKKSDVIVLDHHVPPASSNNVISTLPHPWIHINPSYMKKEEKKDSGSDEICVATLSYLLARRLELKKGDNIDFSGLAIAGALGDKQDMNIGINKIIIDEAIKKGIISVKKGLKIGEGKIKELLFFSTDPYIELVGEPKVVDSFLESLSIDGEIALKDLNEEKQHQLANALLSMTEKDKSESFSSLFGNIYILNAEIEKNSINFMKMVDACGRLGKAGAGIGLCMRSEEVLEEARFYANKFQSKLVSELKRVKENINEAQNIFYFYVEEKGITGVLAGIIARYICTKKPVIALNRQEGKETKVSARCNKKLLTVGIDLACAMEKASKEVGGVGGGHPVASGGSIPEGVVNKFIASIDRIIGEKKL